jgi:hypothetical protein
MYESASPLAVETKHTDGFGLRACANTYRSSSVFVASIGTPPMAMICGEMPFIFRN